MAIDLPPAMPPVLTSSARIAELQTPAAPTYITTVDGSELRISGDFYLDKGELDALFRNTQTASQAILLLNATIARRGHYLVTVFYNPGSDAVLVHALQRRVGEVHGEGLDHYFDDLRGDSDLKRWEFDKARVLANVKSERTDVDYQVSYRANTQDPLVVDLVFTPVTKEDADRTDLILQFGNQGSRFVGRYFADAAIAHNFSSGTSLSFGYETAIKQWGEAEEGDEYQQYQMSLSHPFTFGLYGLDLSHLEYKQKLGSATFVVPGCALQEPLSGVCLIPGNTTVTQEVEIDADIDRAALYGEQVLSSDLDHRFGLFQRAEYIDSTIDSNIGITVQEERYGTLELGARYNKAVALDAQLLRWTVSGSVKGGVTGDDGTLGTNSSAPGVAIGKRTAEFVAFKPKASARLQLSTANAIGIDLAGQVTDKQVPQQQQWVLGGMESLSAYLPGVLVGDTGYHAKAYYSYSIDVGGFGLEFSVFAEQGGTQYEDASGPDGDLRTVADAGVGFKGTLNESLELRAVAARSLADDNVDSERLDDNEADFYFIVKAVF